MSPAGTTQMHYDVWDHLLAETDGAGHVVKQYIWVGDQPVAGLDGTANPASPVLYYVHADHLQRPELMTNASGSVVWTAYYEPFGTVSSITGSLTENQRFPGQWFELEAGLAYNWHRHYDSTLGRYTTPDPLGVQAGPSLFGYVGQNPLLWIDPEGLAPLPNDPSGLPSGWTPDPTHKDPNGQRFRDPAGNILNFHEGRPGLPGFRGKSHRHYNGCPKHLLPGDEAPDPQDPPALEPSPMHIPSVPLPLWLPLLLLPLLIGVPA